MHNSLRFIGSTQVSPNLEQVKIGGYLYYNPRVIASNPFSRNIAQEYSLFLILCCNGIARNEMIYPLHIRGNKLHHNTNQEC